MPTVRVQGRAIHYASRHPLRGRPALVFIHGAGGSHENWGSQVRELGERYDAVAVDLPGHGRSEGDGCRTIPDYRDFVRDLLDALALPRVILVGHSMGGGITQGFALAYPDRVQGIVLVGTGARLRVHPDIFEALRTDPAAAADLVARWAYSPKAAPELPERGRQAYLRCPLSVIEGDFRACDAFDVMTEVSRIGLPTQVIVGGDDRLTPRKYADYLHAQIPASRLAVIPDAGHMVMLEKPAALNAALADFLGMLAF